MRKLRIGIDVDSTLADTPQAVCSVYNHIRKRGEPIMYPDDWGDWGFEWARAFGLSREDMYRLMDDAWEQHSTVMHPLDIDAEPQLQILREFGHQIHVITSRTIKTHSWVAQWLSRFPYDSLSFVENGEDKLRYPIDVLIDDAPIQLEVIQRHAKKHLFLRDQPWNSQIDCTAVNVHRVRSIRDMVHKLTNDPRFVL